MSSTPTQPEASPTFGEEVCVRFFAFVFLILPTAINFVLAVGEYGRPEDKPVNLSFVAWTATLFVFLTISFCVLLAASEAFSGRVHLLAMTAACFSGAAILPWLWDAFLTELGMPGRVYGQPLASAQLQAAGDGESVPLFSAPAEDEESILGDNTLDAADHPKAVRAAEPSGLPAYSTHPTGSTASGSTQAATGAVMAVDAGTVV
ncbi:hypothetical protein C8R44DRAFT_735229 [Mycena epipterygia]|nr:hypothetical protein C8R44DRAFT_735229 [Mycena epipterygia]